MAFTNDEIQSIVSAVLSSLQTNSKTIDQLTAVTTLGENDCFEIGGGKKVTYKVLRGLIASLSSEEQNSLKNLINKCELKSVNISATESSATLTISSNGKTISATIPIATTSKVGLMTATDKVKLQSAYDTAQAAKTDAKAASDTANKALPSTIGIDELDTMGVADVRAMKELVRANALHTRYTVCSNGLIVGTLDIFSDFSRCELTQVLESHHPIENGELQTDTHTDGKIYRYFRSFNFDAPENGGLSAAKETWTKWEEVIPHGAARLDENGKVPEENLPDLSFVVEFGGMVSGVEAPNASSLHLSTDDGCTVKYDTANKRFLLWVLPTGGGLVTPPGGVNFGTYYPNWLDAKKFGKNENGYWRPQTGKLYICTSENRQYRWDGETLAKCGPDGIELGKEAGMAFPGDEGAQMQEDVQNLKRDAFDMSNLVNNMGIFPFDGWWDGKQPEPTWGVWYGPSKSYEGEFMFWSFGGTNFYGKAPEEYNSDDVGYDGNIYRKGNELYRIVDKKLEKYRGSSIGNCYNITIERIANDEKVGEGVDANYYDDFTSAVEYLISKGKASLGMQITYAQALKSWKTWQYVGGTTNPGDLREKDNWIDMAGLTAGQEPVVNINLLCGDKEYNLSTALVALFAKENETGIAYRKEGLVITYKRDANANVWETKQFTGKLGDMTETAEDLWRDFGGGGSEVKSSDLPEDGGKDAFSTGGAYEMRRQLMANMRLDQDADNIIIQGVNYDGNDVGDPISIPKGGGGGGQSGSTLTIYCDQSVWGAAGGELKLAAAIKSVSYDGQDEILGTVSTLIIIDPTTGVELWREDVNRSSSLTASDRKFTFDFSPYVTDAASRAFQIRAIDADGNRATKNIQVTAVDVTCTPADKLAYDRVNPNVLTPGGERKSLSLYAFRKNVSKQGIEAVTEMLWNGEWKELGLATIMDTYTHNVSIDPQNVFGNGEKMRHGAYAIRTRGRDVGSGIYGNTVYTAVMCIDPADTTPVVAMRYDDRNEMRVRLYDAIDIEVAAYTPGENETQAEVWIDGQLETTVACGTDVQRVRQQVNSHKEGDRIEFYAASGASQTERLTVTVSGSVIDMQIKEGAVFGFDFSGRSNSEADHTIADNGIEMRLDGCNWASNGFRTILGETALRIAENVKATIDYAPFAAASTDTAGATVQMAFSTANVRDENRALCRCMDGNRGIGFEIYGTKIVMRVANGQPDAVTVKFPEKEKQTVAIVVEPQSSAVTDYEGTRYAMAKLYVNGELCGAAGFPASTSMRNDAKMEFDSADGDINVNYISVYDSAMGRTEAFANYLCRLTDTDAMVAEYKKEDVLDVSGKPDLAKMKERGMSYYVVVAPQKTFDDFDGGVSTGDVFACTLYYYNAQHPEVNFKAENVYWRRQGTTSAQRPVKNDRFNFNKKFKSGDLAGKKATVTLLNPDSSTEIGRRAIEAVKFNKVYCSETGFFVDVVTVKVDYSDSSNANDCSVCDQMNATFRALGPEYMTPAQRSFDGRQMLGEGVELTGLQMDHSTKNHPISAFRATREDTTDAWFHAKGNWKEDKGEQTALGFKDTPGYNLGCLNYGDFIEYFGTKDETLAQTEARFKADPGTDTSQVYLISQYCGRDYAIYRHKNGAWTRSTGSMKQANGKWVVTGDVLNPVTGYEFLQYDGMCRFLDVASVEDMMAPSTKVASWVSKLKLGQTTYPAWTFYFECMVDDDQLQEDLAMGRKVPYDLFRVLQWFSTCNHHNVEGWREIWKTEAGRLMSLKSMMAYVGFTDYKLAIDQWAKNFQPMFFLEDGCSVEDGHYTGIGMMEAVRMYFNKVYDCDTCEGKDNDGGFNISAETDPALATDPVTGEANPYLGFGSLLYHHVYEEGNLTDADGSTVSLTGQTGEINTMRGCTITLADGRTIKPFSPEGDRYFFMERRLDVWPKQVSSYDGENKYILSAPRANNRYFYALHGLCLTAIPQFIDTRYSMRDGYFKTGTFFDMPWSGRLATQSADARLIITAGKRGYYGVGNDSPTNVTEDVFLEAGESHEFTVFAHNAGALVYIYQADKIAKIDTSELSLDAQGFGATIGRLAIAEEIILGGEKKTGNTSIPGYPLIGSLNFGSLPFLRRLDVSGTTVTGINASECPRLEFVDASDTQTASFDIARTAPVETLKLPATVTVLKLLDLKNMTYPGGLELADGTKMSSLAVSGCPGIDSAKLLEACPNLDRVHFDAFKVKGLSSVLTKLKKRGVRGLDRNGEVITESGRCSGLSGRWICVDFVDETLVKELDAYFTGLNVFNCQMTQVTFTDNVMDSENISNPENRTGYKYSSESVTVGYEPSGHVAKLRDTCPVCMCKKDPITGVMRARPLHNDSLLMYADGSAFDPTDAGGEGYDVMKYIGRYWYKGVNDFVNGEKHIFYSTNEEEPMSTADNVVATTVDEMMTAGKGERDKALLTAQQTVGAEPIVSESTSNDILKIEVEGMTLLRWPCMNAATIACVFLDRDGAIIDVFSFGSGVSDMESGDYYVTRIPEGAVTAWATIPKNCGSRPVVATDSDDIESIEPTWILHKPELVGAYHASADGQNNLRSLSGANTRHGDNSGQVSTWEYDGDGNVTSAMAPATLHFTAKDFFNCARVRGKGYQCQDYESWKDFANLVFAILGTRDVQARCGYGRGGEGRYVTGAFNTNRPQGFSSSGGYNNVWGLQEYMSSGYEWVDNCAVNIRNYAAFKRNKSMAISGDPVNYAWHSWDEETQTERIINGVSSGSGSCVANVRHGLYCDIVPSRMIGDSTWSRYYADKYEFQGTTGRVPLRACNNTSAYGGLVYAYAYYASSLSYTSYGARLAFRGEIELVTTEA